MIADKMAANTNNQIMLTLLNLTEEMKNFTHKLTVLKQNPTGNTPTGEIRTIEENFAHFSLKVTQFMSEVLKKFDQLEDKYDELEQYSRRNCIVLHRVPESPSECPRREAIRLFQEEMGVTVQIDSIDRAHRLRSQKTTPEAVSRGNRPLIVKFTSYAIRDSVFKNKKKLKGKNYSITESLTQKRLKLLKQAAETHGKRNVWTMDGKIVILGSDGKKNYITRFDQLTNIHAAQTNPITPGQFHPNVTLRRNK